MRYLCSTITFNTIPDGWAIVVRQVSREFAVTLARSGDMVSAIGYQDILNAVNADLQSDFGLKCNPVQFKKGDIVLMAQYIGPQLPEGATELPPGAEVRYFTMDVK